MRSDAEPGGRPQKAQKRRIVEAILYQLRAGSAWRLLAHQVAGEVERTYQRSDMLDRRRQMMAQWAAFLRGQEAQRVVPLRAAQ